MAHEHKPQGRGINYRRRLVIVLVLAGIGLLAAYFSGGLKDASWTRKDSAAVISPQVPPPALAIIVKGAGVFEVDGKALDLAGLERRLKERVWGEQDLVKITIEAKEWQHDWEQARALVTKSGVTRVATEMSDAARKK